MTESKFVDCIREALKPYGVDADTELATVLAIANRVITRDLYKWRQARKGEPV